MATDGEGRHTPPGSDGSSEMPRPGDSRSEPQLLPADWPSPVTWGAPLGAGGEVLGDAPDLVRLGSDQGPAADEAEAGQAQARRRAPRQGPNASRRRPRGRSLSLRVPSLGGTVVAAIVVGLAGLMLVVLFSSSGWAPASSSGTVAGLSAAPPQARPELADLVVASQRLASRMRTTAREQQQATIRHRHELARRRARERRSAPPSLTRPVTRQVARPAATSSPPAAASPSVSPAERALTPGPWNLS